MPIPVDFHTVFARCKRVMLNKERNLVAITYPDKLAPIVWESQLKEGGKTRAIQNFEKFARDLQCMSDEEVKNGEWASWYEPAR